jgi:excisionase family DNA binding protein
MSNGNTLLTIEEGAARIRMSVRHVRRLVAEGQIAYHRLGRSIRLDSADLDAYIAAGRVDPIRDEAPAGATAGAFSLTSGSPSGLNTEDRS